MPAIGHRVPGGHSVHAFSVRDVGAYVPRLHNTQFTAPGFENDPGSQSIGVGVPDAVHFVPAGHT